MWRRNAADVSAAFDEAVAVAARHLAVAIVPDGQVSMEELDRHQQAVYDLAFLASEAAALRLVLSALDSGALGEYTARRATSLLVRSARARLDGRHAALGLNHRAIDGPEVRNTLESGFAPGRAARVLAESASDPGAGLPDDLRLAASAFRRFGEEQIAPVAQDIHREDGDVPENIISGLAAMGAFGLSIPQEYGGSQGPGAPDHLAMVIATEELSRASLGAGGSLITRPEILARALIKGGTEEQKRRWLPAIAAGELLVAVAVTEPDFGSDVASIRTKAISGDGGYVLRGVKMWCTFSGRAELLMVLARTDPEASLGFRGLSLFVVEKAAAAGRDFRLQQHAGGAMSGRAIPTIGYRGMHSFEVTFEDWFVPADALIGGSDGAGRGFYLQMDAFAAGRLQTAARAVGVMQAAFEAGLRYAGERTVFGRPLLDYELTRERLADMAARTHVNRLFTRAVAGYLTEPRGQIEASMVKALACRAAEEITRDAMQLFGGYGYAEEYDVSRYFVDARVLSIFEGAEEVLALRVIGRSLIEDAAMAG